MGQKKKKSKEARIKAEVKRLMEQIEGLDSKKKKIAEGLIERAAFMRISLDDMEEDLVLNGFVELFSQSETQEPYERRRPTTDAYNSMNASYQKIIRQLTDLLPMGNYKSQKYSGISPKYLQSYSASAAIR